MGDVVNIRTCFELAVNRRPVVVRRCAFVVPLEEADRGAVARSGSSA